MFFTLYHPQKHKTCNDITVTDIELVKLRENYMQFVKSSLYSIKVPMHKHS